MNFAEYMSPFFDKVGTSVLIVTSLFIRCVLACAVSGYASYGSLHSGQTPDRRMAEASSEKTHCDFTCP